MASESDKDAVTAAFAMGATWLADSTPPFIAQAKIAIYHFAAEFAKNMKPDERAELGVPAVIRSDSGAAPGALLLLEDRAIVAWSFGVLLRKSDSLTVPLAFLKGQVKTTTEKPKVGSGQLHKIWLKNLPLQIILDSALMPERAVRIVAGLLNGDPNIEIPENPLFPSHLGLDNAARIEPTAVSHDPDKPFQCHLCEHAFVSAEKRALHITNFHPSDALASQPATSESGATSVNDDPDKPFQCHLCEQAFVSAEKRALHITNFHPNSGSA